MNNESVITDEMRKSIGIESEPTIVEIEKEPIRRIAAAMGNTNPLHYDEEYAKKHGFRSIVAPPGYNPLYSFPIKTGEPQEVGQEVGKEIRSKFSRGLNGGGEYEFFQPIQAGDILSITHRTSDIYERNGRAGKMVFIVSETICRNLKGETVLIIRNTGIRY
jgi:acyl dehydratase